MVSENDHTAAAPFHSTSTSKLMSVIPNEKPATFLHLADMYAKPKDIALMLNKNLNMARSCKHLHTHLHVLKERYFSHNRIWIFFFLYLTPSFKNNSNGIYLGKPTKCIGLSLLIPLKKNSDRTAKGGKKWVRKSERDRASRDNYS